MVNSGVRYFWAVVLLVLGAAPVLAQGDYGFLWWADGWRGKSAEGERVLCVQTNHYGLALDVHRPILLHLGPIDSPQPYAEAVADANDVIFDLPAGDLSLFVVMDGERYTAVRAAEDVKDRENYPVRLIESGQLVQRFDIQQLVFENESGKPLAVTGRLEVSAWPERVHLTLEVNGIRQNRLTGAWSGSGFRYPGVGARPRRASRHAHGPGSGGRPADKPSPFRGLYPSGRLL